MGSLEWQREKSGDMRRVVQAVELQKNAEESNEEARQTRQTRQTRRLPSFPIESPQDAFEDPQGLLSVLSLAMSRLKYCFHSLLICLILLCPQLLSAFALNFAAHLSHGPYRNSMKLDETR